MNGLAPTLQLPRLTLRPFVPDDIEPLHQIQSVEEVLRYFPRTTPPPRASVEKDVLFQIEHWIKFGYGRWVIAQPSNCHLIGWCGLQYLPDTDEIEIGYLLAKPFWGQGLTTEAAIAAQSWAFEHLDLTELVGIIHPENSASIRVAEKLGMTSPLRTVYFGMDCYRYAITREEFGKWDKSKGHVM
jgi:RimJ/RimL family protein N-acetyltransferase